MIVSDTDNPPHIFYRKYGFYSRETKKLKEVDSAISNSNHRFSFNNIGMFFLSKPQVEEKLSQTTGFWKKLKQYLNKIKF